MDVSIRPATADDLERIVLFNMALARETEGKVLDRSVVRRGVGALLGNAALGHYYLAEAGEEVVGQLAVTMEWSDWRNAPVWWIQSVYVSKRHRRRGIYRLLHEHVRAQARSEGAVGLRLYVERDNRGAQLTYAAMRMSESPYLMYSELWI